MLLWRVKCLWLVECVYVCVAHVVRGVCLCVCGICVCCVVRGSACTCACAVSVLACVCTRVCVHSDSEISFQPVFPLILCDLLAGGWVKVMPAVLKLAQTGTQAAWDSRVVELSGWRWGQSSGAETAG